MSNPESKSTTTREGLAAQHRADPRRRAFLLVAALLLGGIAHGFLPLGEVPADLEPSSVRLGLAILILAGSLWLSEALPLAITALLVPVVASLTGVLEVRAAFASFAHPLIFLFLAGFGMAASLSRHGLDRWLAARVVRLARGHFLKSSIALFSISAALSMWISNTAAVALLMPVALGMVARVSASSGQAVADRITPFLLLGIAYSASVGGIGTLIGTPPNAIAAASLGYGFADWLAVGIPFVVVLLPILFILLWLVTKPGSTDPLPLSDAEPFAFTAPRVLTLLVFGMAVAGWLASQPLSAALGIEKDFDALVAVSVLVLLAALRLVEWKDIDATTDWGVLLLFGGGLTLSQVLGASGASRFLAAGLASASEGLPLLAVVGVVVLFLVFLTELSSNTATAALFVPIFFATAIDLGAPPATLVIPVAVACSCAFMLPIATPPNALVFGSGRIQQRTMMRVGLVLNLCLAVVVTLLSHFLL